MNTEINLENIEKKAFSSTYSDGITDILWGILLIGFGTNTIFTRLGIDRPLSLILFAVPVIVLYFLGKKFITTPRMGYVKFGAIRKKRRTKVFIFAVILQIIFGLLFWLTISNQIPKEQLTRYFNPVIEFMLIVISMSIIAYWIDYPTLYFVALAIGLGWPVAELLDPHTGSVLAGILAFGVSGLAIMIYGLVRFFRFIKLYPKQNISTDYEKPE